MLARRYPSRSTMTPPSGGRDHERKEREEADEPGLGNAPRRLEHEPRDRELRQAVARDRDRVRGEEAEEGRSLLHRSRSGSSRGKRRSSSRAGTASVGGVGARAPQVRREDGVDLLDDLDRLVGGQVQRRVGDVTRGAPVGIERRLAGDEREGLLLTARDELRGQQLDGRLRARADVLGGLEHEAGAGRLPRPVAAGAATRVGDEAEAGERTEVVRRSRGADADRRLRSRSRSPGRRGRAARGSRAAPGGRARAAPGDRG